MTPCPIKEQSQSPSRKELCNLSNDENAQSLHGKNIQSPNHSIPGGRDCHLELHISQSQIPAQDTENSSLRKRRIEELVPEDGYHGDAIRSTKSRPNIHKSQGSNFEFMLPCDSGSDDERKMTGTDTTTKLWSDVCILIISFVALPSYLGLPFKGRFCQVMLSSASHFHIMFLIR